MYFILLSATRDLTITFMTGCELISVHTPPHIFVAVSRRGEQKLQEQTKKKIRGF
jgi:hypothetical protein